MRVGLLGGSFDPVHHGHLIAAGVLGEVLALDEVRLVPAREQPFKIGRHHASAEHRGAMVAAAVAGASGLRLEGAELGRPGPSYTVDTLRELREREPGADFVLLLGHDAAGELDAWKEAAAVRQLATVVAFRRGPAGGADAAPAAVTVPAIDISATEVRQRVRDQRSIRYWVPDAVADYIMAHGLYRDSMA